MLFNFFFIICQMSLEFDYIFNKCKVHFILRNMITSTNIAEIFINLYIFISWNSLDMQRDIKNNKMYSSA